VVFVSRWLQRDSCRIRGPSPDKMIRPVAWFRHAFALVYHRSPITTYHNHLTDEQILTLKTEASSVPGSGHRLSETICQARPQQSAATSNVTEDFCDEK